MQVSPSVPTPTDSLAPLRCLDLLGAWPETHCWQGFVGDFARGVSEKLRRRRGSGKQIRQRSEEDDELSKHKYLKEERGGSRGGGGQGGSK
eukprot:296788-Hanusia_phi.AAC.2